MKKINTVVIIYFLIGLPLVVSSAFFKLGDTFFDMAGKGGFWGSLNSFIGATFGLWIISTFYLGFALISSAKFREELVARIIRLKQRDEREVFSAGTAAKKTFFMSVAAISFLFVVSLVHLQIENIPANQVKEDGHHHIIKMGFGFLPWTPAKYEPPIVDPNVVYNFQLPLTTTGTLLFLLVWQFGSFYWYSHKSLDGEVV